MAEERTVLVHLRERTRPVKFVSSGDDVASVVEATRLAFSEVVGPRDSVALQMKDEDWGGVFVDKLDGEIPSRSVLKAIVTAQVGTCISWHVLST